MKNRLWSEETGSPSRVVLEYQRLRYSCLLSIVTILWASSDQPLEGTLPRHLPRLSITRFAGLESGGAEVPLFFQSGDRG